MRLKSIARTGPSLVLGLTVFLVGCSTLMKSHDAYELDDCPEGADCHAHVKSAKTPTLMALGSDLDHLQRHIDWFGSANAKIPDVWGQARLTEYREQFEALMNPTKEGNKLDFKLGLQGSLARSDQAFFAQATALSFAAQPKPPVIGRVQSTKVEAAAKGLGSMGPEAKAALPALRSAMKDADKKDAKAYKAAIETISPKKPKG